MFKKVQSSFFSGSIARAGIGTQVNAAQILIDIERWLQEEFGKGVERFATPSYIKQGYLHIAITHPAIAEEIQKKEDALIKTIQSAHRNQRIIGVRFIIQKTA